MEGKNNDRLHGNTTRNLFAIMIIAAVIMAGPAAPVFGAQAAKTVTVSMPAYPVIVNGVKIDIAKSKYPFIVYDNITYFPITYRDCRFLGLETQWKGDAEGLAVEKTDITAAYLPYASSATNRGRYTATVATFPITVNGKAVNNGEQQYPLLLFRDVTYFPMTWEFGVGAFGWDYNFSPAGGLVINSDNIKLEQTGFGGNAILKDDEGKIRSAAATEKYIYYQDKNRQIIQAPLSDPGKTKTVHKLPDDDYLPYAGLYIENGEAYLSYHTGGAVMGSDYLFKLNDDGSVTEIQSGYNRVKTFGDKTFSYWTGHAPGPGNLLMAVGEDWVPVGDKDYLYGWSWRVYPDESRSGGGSDDVFLDGENLYILASYWNIEDDVTEENGIYRVNISTNETVRMSEREAMAFKREGDFLYYLNEGALYRVSIKDGKEEFVKQLAQPSVDISGFEIFGGKCYWGKIENEGYYIDENYYNSEGYYLYDDDGKIVNEGAAFLGMKLAGDKKEYLICTFAETDSSKYRIVIFDASGAAIFKSSDTAQIGSMHIIGKTLIFVNRTTGTLCKANL